MRAEDGGMRFVVLLIAGTLLQAGCSRSAHQQDFASAEEAAQALASAARSADSSTLLSVLGAEAKPLVDSGDAVQDKNARERFVTEYEAKHSLDATQPDVVTISVGADQWPFPIPLVERNGRWRFDTAAGAEEIVNRRVGANELATIQSCLAFVDAQREYYSRNPQGGPLLQFAQKLVSTQGQKDGLYWPATSNDMPSPLGESFAQARAEGYFTDGPSKDEPYHGYLYKLLTAQGASAEGGAYGYLVGDKMLGGFALLAFPADYAKNGVMTFIVNHSGVVYSKDLGTDTAKIAQAIETFDPDQSWKREASID
jgi:hypothetical protein